jgi:hypothetical protein
MENAGVDMQYQDHGAGFQATLVHRDGLAQVDSDQPVAHHQQGAVGQPGSQWPPR